MKIEPVTLDNTVPQDALCQEASFLSKAFYIPCDNPAVAVVYHAKDGRGYYMCVGCADHNVRHRGGKDVTKQ